MDGSGGAAAPKQKHGEIEVKKDNKKFDVLLEEELTNSGQRALW